MAKINKQRVTATIEGDFVVFLIGMKINSFWSFHKWVPVARAMPRMINELMAKPESGFLGFQILGGIPPVMVQYWRSFEHLEAYAKDRNSHHYPAWKDFNTRVRSGGEVGIWHETYKVRAGEYECVYNNMPDYGLGTVGQILPSIGNRQHAADRLSTNQQQ